MNKYHCEDCDESFITDVDATCCTHCGSDELRSEFLTKSDREKLKGLLEDC